MSRSPRRLLGAIVLLGVIALPLRTPDATPSGVTLPAARQVQAQTSAPPAGEPSVARRWNEALLAAIRRDTPRPTVHARNLFHVSAAMYDAWAAYDDVAQPVLHRESPPRRGALAQARRRAISYAAYRVLSHRFADSPGHAVSQAEFDALMRALGYSIHVTTTDGESPAAVGNRVAAAVIAHGSGDGANEAQNYADPGGYAPLNAPLIVEASGTGGMADRNRWQPLWVPGAAQPQRFLTPHWRGVTPFALTRPGPGALYLDPGPPPLLGGLGDARIKADMLQLIAFSGALDPSDGAVIDISPAVVGDNPLGTQDSDGHALNPVTGAPYPSNPVLRGDWSRVLAEFWADGPTSSTPPGHWNEIANAVSDHPALVRRIGGSGPEVDALEWDVKLYLALNGAVHDAAIATWEAKAFYDCVRPISLIREMGALGQSSDPALPAFHPQGLPLAPGSVELIGAASTAPGARHAHLAGHEGEIAIRAWLGHPLDPQAQFGGVGWIRAVDWWPYQQRTFVTPPFAGYTSGHSAFSRASAEVLAKFTGDAYFPGGVGEFLASDDAGKGFALRFEAGPSQPVLLQWATYFDAADEAGLSRLYGGIHPAMDDFPGRRIGHHVGLRAFARASALFAGDAE